MGSGLEAFTRLHHGVFLAGAGGGASSFGGGVALDGGPDGGVGGSEAELYVLQLVSSELTWRERGCASANEVDAARLRAGVLRDLVGLLSRDRVEIDEKLFEAHLAMRALVESLSSPEEGAGGVDTPAATMPKVTRQDAAPPRPPLVHLRCGLVEPADGPRASPGVVLTLYH